MNLSDFKPKYKYLLCIDSDGCAVDSMTIKHEKCFGPAFIETFHLEQFKDKCMAYWLKLNLYSLTRGINRFLGLNKALHFVNDNIKPVDDLSEFDLFIKTNNVYSNSSLETYIKNHDCKLLQKCLDWSNLTNQYIKSLPCEDVNLFKNVYDVISQNHLKADICIVSSANKDAVLSEWTRLGLINFVSVLCSQNDGTKEKCIRDLSRFYLKENVLMIGDSPLDLEASKNNNVYFYPILAKHENTSWKNLSCYLDLFYANEYNYCQQKLIDKFEANLK